MDYMNYNDEYSFAAQYMIGDEYILWKGKPEKGKLITGADIFTILFSIVWCGFAIFWELTAIASGAPFFFAMFGLPFVGIGLYLVFGRFIHKAYMRKRTYYVITNKKIIRLRGKRIEMLDGKCLPGMRVHAHLDGSGTIQFGEVIRYRRGGKTYTDSSHVFYIENVANVMQVQQAIDMMERE